MTPSIANHFHVTGRDLNRDCSFQQPCKLDVRNSTFLNVKTGLNGEVGYSPESRGVCEVGGARQGVTLKCQSCRFPSLMFSFSPTAPGDFLNSQAAFIMVFFWHCHRVFALFIPVGSAHPASWECFQMESLISTYVETSQSSWAPFLMTSSFLFLFA